MYQYNTHVNCHNLTLFDTLVRRNDTVESMSSLDLLVTNNNFAVMWWKISNFDAGNLSKV